MTSNRIILMPIVFITYEIYRRVRLAKNISSDNIVILPILYTVAVGGPI